MSEQETENAVPALSDDETLDFTRTYRLRMLNKLTNGGQSLPSDPKEAVLVDSILTSLDRVAIANKRLKKEEEETSKAKIAGEIISQLLNRVGSADVFATPSGNPRPIREALPAAYENVETVPGELDVGLSDMTYADFVPAHESATGRVKKD